MLPALAHVDSWIFDLDNCLYPASTNLFALIDVRMGEYIQRLLACDPAEARAVQKRHFLEHGTTLAGLMRSHDVDPREFLDFVHDIDLARIAADPALVAALDRLPGRKFVFTNASERLCGAGAGSARPRQRLRRDARHPCDELCAQARSGLLPRRCATASGSSRPARSSSRTWRAT